MRPMGHSSAARARARWPGGLMGALASVALLVAILAPGAVSAAGRLAVGVEQVSFRDEALADAYGTRLGVTVAGDLLSRSRWDLTLRASYLTGANDPPHLGFIAQAHTDMHAVPVRAQGRFHQRLGSVLEVWGGPEVVWAHFRERWDADVPEAGVSARQTDSGSWFGLGGIGGVRLRAGGLGHLRASFEYVWCDAQRQASPGNSHQASSMDGGWSAFSLLWEPPWLAF